MNDDNIKASFYQTISYITIFEKVLKDYPTIWLYKTKIV